MTHKTLATIATIATIATMLVCLAWSTLQQTPPTTSGMPAQYTYSTWYSFHGTKPFPPRCTLTGTNGTCLETRQAPTEDEFIAWESYSIWLDCVHFENVNACRQLMN